MYHVFIADKDRENIRKLVRLFQKNYGFKPEVWRVWHDLRSVLRETEKGILLIRIDDPTIRGIELSSQALEYCPKMQLVWMAETDSHALTAFSLGVDAYLLLPVNAESLEKVMRSLELKKTVRTKIY